MSENIEPEEDKPKTQPEAERGGGGSPPRKTAIGYGGDDLSGFKPGHLLLCRIVSPKPGGYRVLILSHSSTKSVRERMELLEQALEGFLPTQERLEAGEEVFARFVCIHEGTILLAAEPAAEVEVMQTVAVKAADYIAKRATDLFPLPADASSVKSLLIGEYDLHWLISDIEKRSFTGVVKTSSSEKKSRGAILLYKSSAVGCVYISESQPEIASTNDALIQTMADLHLPETQIDFYDLPESVVLPLSAIFLGYPVEKTEFLNPKADFQTNCSFYAEKAVTACIWLQIPSERSSCLVFVFMGSFTGAFMIESQLFCNDVDSVIDLLDINPDAQVEVSLLPEEAVKLKFPFGFNLRRFMD